MSTESRSTGMFRRFLCVPFIIGFAAYVTYFAAALFAFVICVDRFKDLSTALVCVLSFCAVMVVKSLARDGLVLVRDICIRSRVRAFGRNMFPDDERHEAWVKSLKEEEVEELSALYGKDLDDEIRKRRLG